VPEVSVIIPNYNHAPYLKQRIDSVLAQTYQDYELIILDDRSVDNSKEVIEEYRGHPKISHIIFNEVNSGTTFKQWKKGIELAQGKYIWMAESDDWCETTLLEVLMNGVRENPTSVIAYAQTYVLRGEIIQRTSTHNKLGECVKGDDYILNYLVNECTIWNASMAVFKKECYNNLSPEFTTFKLSGDWLFYIEMARQGDVFISGRVLNYFRNHDKDVSSGMYRSGNNYLEELQILQILKREGLLNLEQFRAYLLSKYIRFCVANFKFTAEVIANVQQAFYTIDGGSYKKFLTYNAKVKLFKYTAIRRLKLLLNIE